MIFKRMKRPVCLVCVVWLGLAGCRPAESRAEPGVEERSLNKLTPQEEYVIVRKGTERPFTGELLDNKEEGLYLCRRCDAALYRSEDKFDSACGWPSFDDEISGAVKRERDADGRRIEILCERCEGHLGHVFEGEGFTDKDVRHCVNSISMRFVPAAQIKTAIFASGCFWGTEYFLQRHPGVLLAESGYVGGETKSPTYREVSSGRTGHAEVVRVLFDSEKTNYRDLAKLFFETHDPGQVDRQGPDIGPQYRSGIFFMNEQQKIIAEELIEILRENGHQVVTEVTPAGQFWVAEDYHQNYYDKTGGTPYCHAYQKKF